MCRRSPPAKLTERQAVSLLTDQARCFRDAVASRRAGLLAADRFFRDILVYQWRLDALASQIRAVDVADERAATASGDDDQTGGEAACRRAALEACQEELASQREAAVAALAERASSYALCAPASASGRVDRLAATEDERREAVEGLHRLASDTFDEVAAEGREILRVGPGAAALQRLRAALENRQDFWNGQMEDTWAAWQEATERMHRAGDDALCSYAELRWAVEAVVARWQLEPQGLQAPLLQALAAASARLLEAELLEPLGLCGLDSLVGSAGTCAGASDSTGEIGEQAPHPELAHDARLALLASMIEVLRSVGALHRFGDALLGGAAAAGISLACSSMAAGPPMLPGIAEAAAAASPGAAADGAADAAAEPRPELDRQRCLAAWLAAGVAEALCEAAATGDFPRAHGLLELCRALGGTELADLVRASRARSRARRGMTAAEVAAACSYQRLLRLLKAWPDVEDFAELDQRTAQRCFGLPSRALTETPAELGKSEPQAQFLKSMRVRATLVAACQRLGTPKAGPGCE